MLVFFTKADFTRSLIVNEKTAEQDIVKSVKVGDSDASAGSPVVTTMVAAIILDAIEISRVLLGLEFQKCPLSLTLNIRNIAE